MSFKGEITSELTKKGIKELKVGQVLLFDNDTEHGMQLKITRKAKGRVWAKEVYLYRQEEIFVKDKVE